MRGGHENKSKIESGQNGTKKLLAQYGEALVCVRYRYDAVKRKQFKTAEIIISESDWQPPPAKFSDNTQVALLIGATEKSLQELAKAAGGRWDPVKRLWTVRYGRIKGTRLVKLIVL